MFLKIIFTKEQENSLLCSIMYLKGSVTLNKKIFALILAFVIIFALTIPIGAGQILYQLVASQDTLFVDGELFKSGDLPILNLNGVTYAPLRKISDALGATTEYNSDTQVFKMTAGTGADDKSYEEIAKNVKSSVYIVTYADDDGTVQIGYGSGVLVDGIIITNNHVIEPATKYGIVYNNTTEGQEYRKSGYIVADVSRDIAVIPSPNKSAKTAKLGDSSGLKLGQKVVAIGSPLGLKNTVSEGIISGFRRINGLNFIQTTTPTSPGNSGGGLYNMQGELIGIMTMKQVDGENISFAIPINEVKAILNDNASKIGK
jgi:S1-C subfamily serine protease